MTRISVGVVDDHPILLDGLAAIFSANSKFKLVGRGVCAEDAFSLLKREAPDLLILDLSLPGNPFEAIEKLRQLSPQTKIIVFTASTTVDHAVRALESGAWGYVIKGSTAAELFEAIATVLQGHTFITPSFATQVIRALHTASSLESAGPRVKLSLREGQIVKFLVLGHTNKEIGRKLDISEKTVKHYMTLLMQKLHARNRVEVVIAAQKLGVMPQVAAAQASFAAGEYMN